VSRGKALQVANEHHFDQLSFTSDGWVLGANAEHLGRIDETGHVWQLNGTLLGRLDDQGYVRNQFGSVLGRIEEADVTSEAVMRQLWEWLAP
jgi:hypothetical protein